ncbi:MAG: C4-type zinc ribbon domain-containing protein [Nitrospiraceae bacterium]|nr:C4-type zinc ribbon domain-containing protein [Nitrospiraceae bacterium]
MQETIKLLIELQVIDTTIIREKKIIDLMPLKLNEVENSFKEMQINFDKQKQKYLDLEKKRKDKERAVEDINDKIKKIKAHTTDIKTNKEYQAHLKEIETIEKERYGVEDGILLIMEEIDAEGKKLEAEEKKLKEEKEKTDVLKKEVDKEIAEAKKLFEEFKAKRDEAAKKIDADAYKDYMTVFKACAGLAVVEIRDEICLGCNMNIPPQMCVEIKKNEEIIQCPQCRRILYWVQIPGESNAV